MRSSTFFGSAFAGLVVLATVGGCSSGGEDIGAVPVEGTVMMNGQPLAGAAVAFIGTSEGARAAAGITDENGKFVLTTIEQGDGAVPGEYQVTVTKTKGDVAAPTGQVMEEAPEDMDALYAQAEAQGQYPSGPQRAEKIEYVVAERFMNPLTSGLTATVTEDTEANKFKFEVTSR